MTRIVGLIFPGQGVQSEIPNVYSSIDSNSATSEVVDLADEIIAAELGSRAVRPSLSGDLSKIKDPMYLQPTIFSVEVALLQKLKEVPNEISIAAVAGHSLGEYAALVASGAIEFENALRLVIIRGKEMIKADASTPGGGGGMAAINGLDERSVRRLAVEENVELANQNSLSQFVISGIKTHIIAATRKAMELREGAKNVSAKVLDIPYAAHSSYMSVAAEKLREVIDDIEIKKPNIPFISNRAVVLKTSDEIKHHLANQLTQGVQWHTQMSHTIYELGINNFIETGPGKTLSKLLKRSFGDVVTVRSVVQEK